MSEARTVQSLFDLSGRVALVTGGSRGLGLEIAHGLGEAGAQLVVTARRAEWLEPAERELRQAGVGAWAAACDVSEAGQVERLVSSALERHGKIDILVNAAGVTWGAVSEEMPLDRWRSVMDVNATGTFICCQAVGRLMLARESGRIINVASIAGLVGQSPEVMNAVGYTASKGAIIALTRDLGVKWARRGVTVNAIAPGFFPTRMSRPLLEQNESRLASLSPMGRLGRPSELKGVAVLLASDASSYITGQVIAVDGGATAW
ncbi:MAG TPA: SDR family oxidoreductase [Chloroflexota bacterium]|nr:SDR family oxidoreductase [Chloroflexota bacterium]